MELYGGNYRNIVIQDIYTNVDSSCLLYLDAGNSASYSGSGTTWRDLSSRNNTQLGTQNIAFNSANSGYFNFTDPGWFQYQSSPFNVTYTGKTIFISAMLVGTMTNGQYRCLFGSNGANRNFNLYFYYDGNYKLHYSAGATGGFSSNMTYVPGQWGTFAVTHTTGGVLTYYFNGQQISAQTGITFSQYLSSSSENVGASDNYWNGRIGVVGIYGRTFSSAEIAQTHNGFKKRYGL